MLSTLPLRFYGSGFGVHSTKITSPQIFIKETNTKSNSQIRNDFILFKFENVNNQYSDAKNERINVKYIQEAGN